MSDQEPDFRSQLEQESKKVSVALERWRMSAMAIRQLKNRTRVAAERDRANAIFGDALDTITASLTRITALAAILYESAPQPTP